MAKEPLACVIDANVALKLFFDQLGSDRADALFSHLEVDARVRFYVPDFFYAECASAFAKYVRAASYSADSARRDFADLLKLPLDVVPTADLAEAALDIALAHRLSGYDAMYVALAARLALPLITADEKLVRALSGRPYSVHSLAAFDIPPLPPR